MKGFHLPADFQCGVIFFSLRVSLSCQVEEQGRDVVGAWGWMALFLVFGELERRKMSPRPHEAHRRTSANFPGKAVLWQ